MKASLAHSADKYTGEYFMCATPCSQGVNHSVYITIGKEASDDSKISLRLLGYSDGNIHEFYLIEGQKRDENNFSLMSLATSKYEIDEGSGAAFNFEQGTVELKLIGNNCEDMTFCKNGGQFDDTQQKLNNNIHPFTIYNDLVDIGTPPELALKRLYGKKYKGGLIFHLNIEEGTGLVAATEDQGHDLEWGCELLYSNIASGQGQNGIPESDQIGDGMSNTEIMLSVCNTDESAAKLCGELGKEWFLPSKSELELMYNNLHANGYGGFAAASYWSSTGEVALDLAWALDFAHHRQNRFTFNSKLHVRAAQAF